jgi:putative membrane protein
VTFADWPGVNAGFNALSALFLLAGLGAVRMGRVPLHKCFMGLALLATACFLGGYLYYHFHAGTHRFPGRGWVRPLYFFVLSTHTLLAAAILPLVLRTVYLALRNRIDSHRRWARVAWPLWMYVSLTGVLVYFFLYRWYPA